MVPQQKRGSSNQDVQTPPELIAAIQHQFNVKEWMMDLAANEKNTVAGLRFLGPGSPVCEDSFKYQWPLAGDCWLNPPYADIEPWASRCFHLRQKRDGRIFMLIPASTGANWCRDYVLNQAHVIAIAPRVTFVGHTHPYPKDLLLTIYSQVVGGVSTWRWKP